MTRQLERAMSVVKLWSYEHEEPCVSYQLDQGSGEHERVLHQSSEEARDGARGFADVRTVGIRRRREVFAAMYSWQELLHVVISPHHFTWPGPFTAKRGYRRLGGPIKVFSIGAEGREHMKFFYLFYDGSPWPGAEALDIFAKMASETSSPAQVYRFIQYWEGSANGEDVRSEEFQQQLAAYVRQRVAL